MKATSHLRTLNAHIPASREEVSVAVSDATKRTKRRVLKRIRKLSAYGFPALHMLVLVVIAAIVAIAPSSSSSVTTKSTSDTEAGVAIDTVSAADVAARVAKAANVLEADSVANQADSLNVQVDFGGGSGSYLTKPQLVLTGIKTRKDITTYTTVAGDTISSIAQKFNVTSDTIRWANSVQGEAIAVGKQLRVLPVSGVEVTVKAGDTAESLAKKYQANKDTIVSFNDSELEGLKVGEKIIIPGGIIPAPVVNTRLTGISFNAPQSAGFAFGTEAIYGGNGYAFGYCTWHAANRRIQIGHPVPRNLGNAITWFSAARAAGIPVGNAPQAGAVLWHRYQGGLGHVAFVEKVNPDGSYLVSDMNYAGNWNRVTYRTVQPSETYQYGFIYF